MNTTKQLKFITLIIAGIMLCFSAWASDLEKEKRWAEQIVDSLLVGEATWLNVGKDKVLALYTENTSEKAIGGAIVVHGIGAHPNWADIIHPLRTQLPEHGWHTLSVQLPIMANDAEVKDYAPIIKEAAPRLDAAAAFLKSKGVNNIVIIAHSLGATMSAYYLANKPKAKIQAFVAIGASGEQFEEKDKANNFLTSLAKISMPVFDLYGSEDVRGVMTTVKKKSQTAAKAGNKRFTQLEVKGANHFFSGKEEELVKRVRGWLANNAAGKEIPKK